jgi:hypothetical protein
MNDAAMRHAELRDDAVRMLADLQEWCALAEQLALVATRAREAR